MKLNGVEAYTTMFGGNNTWWTAHGKPVVFELEKHERLTILNYKFTQRLIIKVEGRTAGESFCNVELRGCFFQQGVKLVNCCFPLIDHCHFLLQAEDHEDRHNKTGLLIKSDTKANGPTVRDSVFNGWATGIKLSGDMEGGHFDNVTMVGCDDGYWRWRDDSVVPGITITDGHINVAGDAIDLERVSQATVRDTLVYHSTDPTGIRVAEDEWLSNRISPNVIKVAAEEWQEEWRHEW